MSEALTWKLPKGVNAQRATNFASFLNARGWYIATVTQDADALRISLMPASLPSEYFRKVEPTQSQFTRWSSLGNALADWRELLASVTSQAEALKAARRLPDLDPNASGDALHQWINTATLALTLSDAEVVPQIAAWVESEFVRRFGPADTLAYVRPYESVASLHLIETMAKIEVMDVEQFAAILDAGSSPRLLAEQSHSAVNANYFLIPLAIAYPDWIGTAGGSMCYEVILVLQKPRTNMPLLDVRHLITWRARINAWQRLDDIDDTRSGQWLRLTPAQNRDFVEWYVSRLNLLLAHLADPATTATVFGALQPLNQIALVRSVLQLQDIVGRMLVTSDHFARALGAIQILARFDDLGWEFRQLLNPDWLAAKGATLFADPEVGAAFGAYARMTQSRVVEDLLKATHATATGGRLLLASGRDVKTLEYLGEYLKAVRDSIHKFDVATLKKTFGATHGILPIELSQFAAALWLMFLADPDDVVRQFRA